MAFLDDLKKTVSDTTQGAKNLAETAKLNSRVNDLEKKNNAIFAEIGKKYYEKTKDKPDEELASLYVNLEENSKTIDKLKTEIRELKGIVLCPNCGAESKNGEKFCIQCGARVREDEPQETEPERFCATCGEQLEPGANVCPKCGGTV
jgi:predicted RNase H-like nuclease (RuvC/YqgF family)